MGAPTAPSKACPSEGWGCGISMGFYPEARPRAETFTPILCLAFCTVIPAASPGDRISRVEGAMPRIVFTIPIMPDKSEECVRLLKKYKADLDKAHRAVGCTQWAKYVRDSEYLAYRGLQAFLK